MSQEKVDRKKEQKANRKQELAKERRNRRIATALTTAAAVALVAWIGVSGYRKIQENRTVSVTSTPVLLEALTDYLDTVLPEE